MTVDRFTSPDAWRRFLVGHGPGYAELDRRAGEITLSEQELATAVQA